VIYPSLLALGALLAGMTSIGAADGLETPAFEREIRVREAALVAVRLDRHVYEAARSDLADLRVLDARGEAVPYELDRVPAGSTPERPPEVLAPGWSRVDERASPETVLTIDLGARHQPYVAIDLEIDDAQRPGEVRLEEREELGLTGPSGIAPPERWLAARRPVVRRLEEEGRTGERLRIEASGRARVLRLRLRRGGERPLRIKEVKVVVPLERLVFEALRAGTYTLTYGGVDLRPPSHGLARILDEERQASPVELGPPLRRGIDPDVAPWTTRHPVLTGAGLLLLVAALGSLSWRALRAA
jgi:hypothetical protein